MFVDYYEVLQISPNADQETVHRVYRIQAQRFHPDNLETGDAGKFRAVAEAYQVLSNPLLAIMRKRIFLNIRPGGQGEPLKFEAKVVEVAIW